MFDAGLGLHVVASVRTAVAVGRAGLGFAAGMLLYLPQFFADPALRIARGVLLAICCMILAVRVEEWATSSATWIRRAVVRGP